MKRSALAAFLALCLLCSPAAAAQGAESTLAALRANHGKYMDDLGNGCFCPDSYLIRSQAAQMLYNCLTGDLLVA